MKKLLALLLSVILAVMALTSCDILGIDLGFDLNLPDIDMGDSSDGTDDTPDVPDNSGVCSHATTVTVGQKSETCTAPGYTGDTVCSSCNAVIVKGSAIEAKGHSYVVGVCAECGADDPNYTPEPDDGNDSVVDKWLENYNCITVSEALKLCEQFVDSPSSTRYYMVVTIDSIDDAKYGKLTVSDSTGSIMVYGTRSADGSELFGNLAAKPSVGDTILIYGTLQNYKSNTKEVQNAWLIDFVTDVDDNGGNNGGGSTTHIYNDFTADEKALFNEYFGFVIPFLPNDDYYVEEYTYEDEVGINFYAFDNVQSEFNAYLALYSSYTNDGTEVDEYGDTWYFFSKNGVYVDMTFYYYDGNYVFDLYVYYIDEGGSGSGSGGNNGGGSTDHLYSDFTADEKALFGEYFGFVIPFIPNDEYYVEEYEYDTEIGLNFYAFGNTEAEFDSYLALYSSYTNDGTDVDEYGDTWYFFSKNGFYVDICYYYYEDSYVVDVYVYYADESGSGSGSGGGSVGGNDDVITNDGAGLPTGTDGVYDVDFTDADKVKDVTDQGYYLDGCPTTGSPAVLVIPIQFSDAKASAKGYSIDAIENAFLKNGVTDYYSVYDYYYVSSYGALTLDITVVSEWFTPKYNSSYYADYYDSDGYFMGDQLIMDEALAYLSTFMDLSDFDSDGNSIIDAVVLINTLDVGDDDFHWAYRYWNYLVDDEGYYYEYDGVSANDYLWASYQFLHEGYDANGDVNYDNVSGMDTYTYIHEFGHVLGADDYYDTSYNNEPLGGCDIMDSMKGDHNAYTKFNFGWITTSRLVVADGSLTLTLDKFSKNGDTIIIANNWDPSLGAYQEYYVIMYYTGEGLNSGDGGYFSRDGVVVYHVNASLYTEEYDGVVYYDVYNNNTDSSDQYGTENNLIEFVKSSADTYTYVAGDTLPTLTLDGGETLHYTFTVDSIEDGVATITFTKA